MKKYWKYIIWMLVVGFIIYFIMLEKPQYNTFAFPQTLIVHNYTDNAKVDTVVMIILNKIMLYDTMMVNVYPLNDAFDTPDFVIEAHILKNEFEPHSYNIFLKNYLNLFTVETTLSHEIIHIDQMEHKLLSISKDSFIWKNAHYSLKEIKYENRPHELDAYNRQDDVYKNLIEKYRK